MIINAEIIGAAHCYDIPPFRPGYYCLTCAAGQGKLTTKIDSFLFMPMKTSPDISFREKGCPDGEVRKVRFGAGY